MRAATEREARRRLPWRKGQITAAGDWQRPARPRRGRRGPSGLWLAVVLALVVVVAVAGIVWMRSARSDSTAATSPSASPSTAAASPSASSTAEPISSPAPSVSASPHVVDSPQPVPILVYHHVGATHGGDKLLYVGKDEFAAQLAYLKRHGYEAVTLRTVYEAWMGEGTLPAHPVVITFDDGYVDQVRVAAPLLHRYGWPAEIALVFNTLYKGTPAPSNCLTPALVQRLVKQGWGIESHTVSHCDLTELSGKKLRHELEYSRMRLRQIFDVPVDFLCYPGGSYNRRVERAARSAGYLAATSTDYAAATPSDLYALPRIYCYAGESLSTFGKRLRETLAAAHAK